MKELRERVISGDATAALQEFFTLYCFSGDDNALDIKEKIANGLTTPQGRLEDSAQICPKCSGRGHCDKSSHGNLEYGTCDKCGGTGKLLPC